MDVVVALRRRLSASEGIADVVSRRAWTSTQAQRAATATAGHSASPAFARWIGGLPTMPAGTDQPTAQAVWAAEREVELVQQLWGEGYELAVSLRRLGLAYRAVTVWDKAMATMQRALELARNAIPGDTPETGAFYRDIGYCGFDGGFYVSLGRLDDSLTVGEATYDAYGASEGPAHPDTLRTAVNLAATDFELNHIRDALRLAEPDFDRPAQTIGPHGLGRVSPIPWRAGHDCCCCHRRV
jgi:hypothetical protein